MTPGQASFIKRQILPFFASFHAVFKFTDFLAPPSTKKSRHFPTLFPASLEICLNQLPLSSCVRIYESFRKSFLKGHKDGCTINYWFEHRPGLYSQVLSFYACFIGDLQLAQESELYCLNIHT